MVNIPRYTSRCNFCRFKKTIYAQELYCLRTSVLPGAQVEVREKGGDEYANGRENQKSGTITPVRHAGRFGAGL